MQESLWKWSGLRGALSDAGTRWTVFLVTPMAVTLGIAALRSHEPAWLLHVGFGLSIMVLLAAVTRTLVRAADDDFGRAGDAKERNSREAWSEGPVEEPQMRTDLGASYGATERNIRMNRLQQRDVSVSANNIETNRRIER